MTPILSAPAPAAATLPLFPQTARPNTTTALIGAATTLMEALAKGQALDAHALRAAMEAAFGASDTAGAWDWKLAYEAGEAAQILFLRKFGPAMRARAGSPAAFLAMLGKLAALAPSQTRRSEESQALQQFSTPIALGFAAATAAAITSADLVLEPSAGTGLLAIFAELAGARLSLNEFADTRAALLDALFPATPVSRFDAAHIHDHLDGGVRPIVVLMNPPFSAAVHVEGRVADAAHRHISSALARLADGGRLVAITGANLAPDTPAWREGFVRLQERGRILFSAAIDGAVYARHGTNVATRLTVIDRVPAADPSVFPASPGVAPYAQRLGLWGGADFPFATRAEFVQAIEAGGVAAMEVLARDLKALGLYASRSLSYEGVEYELVEHALTPEQVRIYDAYAGAFQIIHNNLTAALEATNVTGSSGTLNAQAKAAARSAFESAKQRFFNHLITAMKTPSLCASIDRDLAAGHAAIVQIVSTGEALMERRLAEIPTEEWGDVSVDITPREYVLDYLAHSFPTQLFEPYTDEEGNLASRPVFRDGQPVQCRDAVERRDRMIERLAALPPVPGALDQIVQRFGTDQVAEVTGRSRRIVRKRDRLSVENRAGSANLAEAQAFMDDEKRILVFSDAGGTGRSYHADLSAKNRRLRVHYLLEAGWKADTAIQGLGRSNRTNQAQPPLFRPVATNIKAEKRFLSTIARRLDTLGAITRGQRQTGGQGLFRADDNLESIYGRAALRQLYWLIYSGKVEGCSLQAFEEATGLSLTDKDGGLRDELPAISTFLNRLLALTIDLQNTLFAVFEELLTAKIEGAIASGTYDLGVETLTAESLAVTARRTIYVHPATGAETQVFTVARRDRNRPLTLDDALALAVDPRACLLLNARSGRAAVRMPAPSLMLDDGEIERRVRLLRPMERNSIAVNALAHTEWHEAGRDAFTAAWNEEVAAVPEFATSSFHIVTGLLLPIWTRLPQDSSRVYRLQTDAGERVIGRLVSPAWIAQTIDTEAPSITPDDAWNALLDGKTGLELADGLELRRVKVMHEHRVELAGFTDGMVDRLKAMGLVSEIISWRLRLFVPVCATGPAILAALMERHPLARIVERGA